MSRLKLPLVLGVLTVALIALPVFAESGGKQQFTSELGDQFQSVGRAGSQ